MKSSALFASFIAASAAWYTNPVTKLMRESAPAVDILEPSKDPWYSAANFEHAAPGTILKVRLAAGNITTVQGNSSAAYNILYRTTDSRYLPTWAVTTLFVPNTTILFGNDRLLSYQIPYDSADINASPSYALYGAGLPDIGAALGKGWYVNVPDYEGPLASFTAGVMSGHATLDSVRAVLNSGFGLRNGTKYAMWGYSGGALASEWAAELQVQYAQDLKFAGAALGGLTPNVTSVLEISTGTVYAGLIPAGILGLASQYPDLEQYLVDNIKKTGEYNATMFFNARNQTLIEAIGAFNGDNITDYFEGGESTLFSPISRRVINRDGIMGYHGVPQMPVFAYKAIGDDVSPINDTDKLVARYCGVGATIRYDRNTVGNHGAEATNGHARAVAFLNSVLGGTYNATGCQIQNVTLGI